MQYVFLDLLGERMQLLSISAAMILAFKAGRVERLEFWKIHKNDYAKSNICEHEEAQGMKFFKTNSHA